MTDEEISRLLNERVTSIRDRMAVACGRVGRNPAEVTLVAVTKTVSPRVAGLLPDLGVFDLGESRPQELWRKAEALRSLPIRWHMIGHFQRNKVERTLPLTDLIHGVDSLRLLEEIAKEGTKQRRRPRVLLQANASHEEQKHGFSTAELVMLAPQLAERSVEVLGLMGMAALSEHPEDARPAFRELKNLLVQLNSLTGSAGPQLNHLSMGMSGDFEVAIEEGATIVRVGSTIFEGLEAE